MKTLELCNGCPFYEKADYEQETCWFSISSVPIKDMAKCPLPKEEAEVFFGK